MMLQKYAVMIWVLGACCAMGGNGDWPQYRGQQGNGASAGAKLAPSWPATGPKQVWRLPIGPGYGELAVVDGAIYTNTGDVIPSDAATAPPSAKEYLVSYDAGSGKERWRHEIGDLLVTEFGNGSRSTPAVDGDLVFIVSGKGNLVACSIADGSERWRVNYPEVFKSELPSWGYSSSPVVEGDTLVVVVGGADEQCLLGLDKRTGAKRWGALKGRACYATPVRADVLGKRQLVIAVDHAAYGLDMEGKQLWTQPFGRFVPIAMPTFVAPDMFLFSSNDEGLAMMVKIEAEGAGLKAREVWQNKTFKNHFGSSVVRDGVLYGFDVATLKAIDANSGEQLWARRGYGKGALILAGDKLLILTDRGKLVMGKADRSVFTEQASVQALEGRCWTAPVLVGTRLYLRHMEERVCYDLGQ